MTGKYKGVLITDSAPKWYTSMERYFRWRSHIFPNTVPELLEWAIREIYPEGIIAKEADRLWNKIKKMKEL